MYYQQAKHLKSAEFERFWGVKPETFQLAGLYNYELRLSSGKPIRNSYELRLAIAFFRPHTTPAATFARGLIQKRTGQTSLANYAYYRLCNRLSVVSGQGNGVWDLPASRCRRFSREWGQGSLVEAITGQESAGRVKGDRGLRSNQLGNWQPV